MRRLVLAAGVLVVVFALPALTAMTCRAPTRARPRPGSAGNDVKPAACAGINIVTVVVGTNGPGGRDLVLGTAAGTTVRGRASADCVLGGGGDDTVNGDGGNDVCIGGPGSDTFLNCETQIP